ncbi:ABC transporter permease [Paenibacillus polymyxa]|jgi:putative ABC transport system permease protein|uniref:ABC transporter permease n=1 Tax=Paenibacillus polymyxa TaxID=1406 RepID=UPI00157FE603|nr:ABC transporter permease [Paenibacillus polymyxa]MBY0024900.1 ABC transporter permease [Paenibacillus polymyxa]MBY0058450.1 ABC transporter permease [Paenibacillus polymyxa]MBY0072800.1 ABC transporter permease [Paenibacillus polymyxa]MBY0080022.1 ABC transporter permease [Paenibacillus polymyxa]NUH13298.1 ABC transporter permease [Paenibacillus polymyxa]
MHMSFRLLAWNNLKHNARAYVPYYLSSSLMITIFFVYAMFIFHPDVSNAIMAFNVKKGLQVADLLIFVFSFFFVLYTNNIFIAARKKEFGILTILGTHRRQIYFLVAYENLIIGFLSLITGITGGFVSAKFFLLLGSSATGLYLTFYFPWKALAFTVVGFMFLFTLISLVSVFFIRQSKLQQLFSKVTQLKKEPKASWSLSFLAIALIGAAVYLMKLDFPPYIYLAPYRLGTLSFYMLHYSVGDTFKYTIVMGFIGIYLLYAQSSVLFIQLLRANRKWCWSGTRLLWLSEITYKMRNNAGLFTLVTLISIVSFLGAASTFDSMQQQNRFLREQSYSFAFFSDVVSSIDLEDEIDQNLYNAGVDYSKSEVLIFPFREQLAPVMKQSNYEPLASKLKKQIQVPALRDDQGFFIFDSNGMSLEEQKTFFEKRLTYNQGKSRITGIQIVDTQKIDHSIKFDGNIISELGRLLVVSDQTYEHLVKQQYFNVPLAYKSVYYFVPKWKSGQVSLETSETQEEVWLYSLLANKVNKGSLNSRAVDYLTSEMDLNISKFIGGFIAIIMLASTVSLLYFRLYVDLKRDEEIYRALSKIGLSSREMRRAASRQIAFLFLLPLVVSSIGIVLCLVMSEPSVVPFHLTLIQIMICFWVIQFFSFLIVRFLYLRQLDLKML